MESPRLVSSHRYVLALSNLFTGIVGGDIMQPFALKQFAQPYPNVRKIYSATEPNRADRRFEGFSCRSVSCGWGSSDVEASDLMRT